ncbi:DNA ligase D [Halobacillus halophilus]|uniref:DNA ligase D n=1 Tax=Halobacillus halophilus TaxID=1570 RepID=UPI00136FA9E5|nr:DNA ligase D [Halobacillus halophilus]MYL29557.1 DNA ligase D [Halobacillus halophilus]
MKRPMLLTSSDELPEDGEWIFEPKYDGFRAFLEFSPEGIRLISRNGKDLTEKFPEICSAVPPPGTAPFTLDGEIVILNTAFQANFKLLQKRGRLKNPESIQNAAKERPALFMAFDFVLKRTPLEKRKQRLTELLDKWQHPGVQEVGTYQHVDKLRDLIHLHLGEGIIAKRCASPYRSGERTQHWLKWKLWKTASVFLTHLDPSNGYVDTGVYNGEQVVAAGRFKHGLSNDKAATLRQFFKEKGKKEKGLWTLPPSVCADIHCLGTENGEFREPAFHQFRFDQTPDECTEQKMTWDVSLFPDHFEPTNLEKELFPGSTKRDYLVYIRHMAPYMLPYMKEKKLTIIRFPDGIHNDSFFQKHRPDYAPESLKLWMEKGEPFMLCEELHGLLWLANQGAIEFHLLFEKAGAVHPDEIVLDLDPPEKEAFPLCITAAQLCRKWLDELGVISFVKLSGSKGMQLHIPLQEGDLSYEETRVITETLGRLLVETKPDLFTVERLKRKRGSRLYIDYVQHGKNKTIIAPYSLRAKDNGPVAAPLYWEEIDEHLNPRSFTLDNMLERLQVRGDPFQSYEKARTLQPIDQIKKFLDH